MSERWVYAKTKGSRWLFDVLKEPFQPVELYFRKIKRSMTNSRRVTRVAVRMTEAMTSLVNVPRTLVGRSMSALSVVIKGARDHRDEESQGGTMRADSPTNMFGTDNGTGSLGINGTSEKRKLSDIGKGVEHTIHEDQPLVVNTLAPVVIASPPSAGASSRALDDESALETTPVQTTEPAGPVTPKNARFKAAAKKAMATLKITRPANPLEPIRSMSSPSVLSESRRRRDSSEHQLNPTHMQGLVPMLRTLRSSQMLGEHIALVKHLQFSPDGQSLATCSWDKTALIWKVGTGMNGGFEVQHKLVHPSRIGDFLGQVAWSPSGDQLLTKQLKAVKVWDTKNGVCKRTIDRKRNVQSITWLPKGSGFVSVEWRMERTSAQAEKRAHYAENIVGSDLVILSADGTVKDDYYLDRLQVWDAVVTPDEQRVVAVATVVSSVLNLKLAKLRSQKRILIYNLDTKEIENQVPLRQEVRNVTLTEQGTYALVSHEARDPPQAWRIDMITREQRCRLVLAHTYFTKHPVDFAGQSYFGGVGDAFVLCASKGGEIYIWERASGLLLHSLKAPDQELTNIAWNHKSPSGFMFASAAHDGMVRIWTTTAPPVTQAQVPARSLAPSPDRMEVKAPIFLSAQQDVVGPDNSPIAGRSIPFTASAASNSLIADTLVF
ncbi:hypothetical protein FRC12_008511 [Ceratobasidium sp. 428]|nr:hypothetical protein FRC12_008511 [Ceratobasidium sp. 428]